MTAADTGQVRVPVADLRAKPDDGAERVNQALLSTPVTINEERTDPEGRRWLQVDLPDYPGWLHADAVVRAPAEFACQVRVAALRAALRILGPDGQPGPQTLTAYAGTALPLAGAAEPDVPGVRVCLPDGRMAEVETAVLAPHDPGYRGDTAAVIATARAFLGTPYLWGGMTVEGIDCSGLVQIAHRVHSWTLPRDADQQLACLPHVVAPQVWEPGDLIFYGHAPDTVIHVMLYIGAEHVLHARGGHGVVIQSMNPAHPDYHARADEYLGARRVIPMRKT